MPSGGHMAIQEGLASNNGEYIRASRKVLENLIPRFRCLLSSSHSSSPLVGFLHPRPFTFNVLEMFSFTRMVSSVSAALALASVSSVLAAPVHNNVSPLVSRATAPSPAFVIYTDKFVSGDVLPPATQLAVSVLCFGSFTAVNIVTHGLVPFPGLQRRGALLPDPQRRTRPGWCIRRAPRRPACGQEGRIRPGGDQHHRLRIR